MIDFSNLKLEGEAAAALDALTQNEQFTGYLSEAVQNRTEASQAEVKARLKEFRDNNISLQQKLDGYAGIDVEEYKQLKALGGKGADVSKLEEQFNQQLQGKADEAEELRQQLERLSQSVEQQKFTETARGAISQYNTANKTVSVVEGADGVLIDKIKANSKIVDGKLIMLDNSGKEFITDSGIGTIDQWINQVARKEYPFLFNKPSGSGAAGSISSGAGAKTISRRDFDAISDPKKRAEVARTYTITM